MKKLLSLLSVLTISGTAVPTTIAASPYQKEEINSYINYQQTNNLERLNRSKRANNYNECIGKIGGISGAGQAVAGAAVGAGIGSVVPVLGTAVGAVIGAGVGFVTGGGLGAGVAAITCPEDIYISNLNINKDLGILNDNDSDTILNKLKEKNPELNINGLVINKKFEDNNKKNISSEIVASHSSIYKTNSSIIVNYLINRDLHDTSELIVDWYKLYNQLISNIKKDIENWLPNHINNQNDIDKWERDTNFEINNLLHELKQDIDHVITNNYIRQLYSRILHLENDLSELKKIVNNLYNNENCSSKTRKLNSASSVLSNFKEIINKKPIINDFIPNSAKLVPVVGQIFSALSVINSLYCSLNKLFD